MHRRKSWISGFLMVVGVAAVLHAWTIPARAGGGDRFTDEIFTVDVAVDMRTFAIVPSAGNPPGEPAGPNRGTPFIVNGAIFPGGALPSGAASNDPSQAGSLGTWICRGVLTSDLADQLSGSDKVGFDTTQMFVFGTDKTAIWTEGLEAGLGEAGVKTHRIILGGTGRFRNTSGEVLQESLGTNMTGAPNIRLTFRIRGSDSD